jgi:16S rRNA processing protein RimM
MVVLGRIVAPYGVKGWVKVQPYGDDPLSWGDLAQWWLGGSAEGEADTWRAFDLLEVRAHSNFLLARFEGVEDRNRSEALKGALVAVPRQVLPALPDDQFYWGDLVGLEVANEDGQHLGRVAALISAGAHDVIVVHDDSGRERLLPFVEAVVKEVDRAAGAIRVAWQADW